MNKTFSLTPVTGRFSPWLAALLAMVAVKAVLSLSVNSVPFVFSYSGISYLLLLILATGFCIRNGIFRTLRARPFWVLLAAGFGLWASHQFLVLYYELGLHIEVPNNSITDDFLFLHLVMFIAAVATLPNLYILDGRQHRWILNTFLILGFWAFLYGLIVAPYKYLFSSPNIYGARFDMLYLVGNLALIVTVAAFALRARSPWKMIYLHLLGASTLYTFSSTLANLAIDNGGYANGKLYGLGLTASVCWFLWIPLSAQAVPEAENDPAELTHKQGSQVSAWAMVSVVLISIPMAWELYHRHENASVSTLRLIVATFAIVLLAGAAYLREYFDKRELAWSFNRRLIQAQEEERTRIARVLHDDISQRVAVLALRLQQLKASPGGLPPAMSNTFCKIQKEATELSMSVVDLSHELHPPTLELLGLGAAIRGWCSEFSDNRNIEVLFDSHDVPRDLSLEISLNLYRVLQEALNNAAKHSGAKRMEVRLWGTPGGINLRVTDPGKGFDIRSAMKGRGLGLKSMRERVKSMNGVLAIQSEPNGGTAILARVPLVSIRQRSRDTNSA